MPFRLEDDTIVLGREENLDVVAGLEGSDLKEYEVLE